eukprot:Gb_06595 [translate_table: standard]
MPAVAYCLDMQGFAQVILMACNYARSMLMGALCLGYSNLRGPSLSCLLVLIPDQWETDTIICDLLLGGVNVLNSRAWHKDHLALITKIYFLNKHCFIRKGTLILLGTEGPVSCSGSLCMRLLARRTMEEILDQSADPSVLSSGKRRGRPRKGDTVLLPGEIAALGVLPSSDGRSVKPRLADNESSQSGLGNNSLIGQTVHGVLDGSFDAGYLITVRVGQSDTVFRGVVFGPGLSIPPSKINDIASNVKHTNRDENTSFSTPLSSHLAPTPVALSEVHEPTVVIAPTPTPASPAEMGAALENGRENPLQQNKCTHVENAVPELPEVNTQDSMPELCDPVEAIQASLKYQAQLAQGDAPTLPYTE